MIRKLRVEFVCFIMLLAACLLAALFGTQAYYLRLDGVRDQLVTLHRIARSPDGILHGAAAGGEEGVFLPYFTLTCNPDGELAVYGVNGFEPMDEAYLNELYALVLEEGKVSGVLNAYHLRYLRAAAPPGEKIVFADISGTLASFQHMERLNILLAFGTLAVIFCLSLLLSKLAVKPVEEAWRQQRNFVADASHELKTPLTVIISNAELLHQPGYDEAQRRRFAENILVTSRKMRHLTESMLGLARLDSLRDAEKKLTELDFSALVENALLPFEPMFFEQGLHLETQVEAGIRVIGNEDGLRQCVDILLDNACKYSEPGCVFVDLRRDGRRCELTVANPYPELSREECREVFRRFYRRDPARSSGVGGYGLGLPIAEGIITHHGGKIACEWEAGELRFTVSIPVQLPLR